MLWRESYSTRILSHAELPNLVEAFAASQPAILAASFGTHSIVEQSVWWRLFQSDFKEFQNRFLVFVQEFNEKVDIEEVEAIIPASDHEKIRYVTDFGEKLQQLVGDSSQSRGFAALVARDEVKLFMIGPPTEEAWETFANALNEHLV